MAPLTGFDSAAASTVPHTGRCISAREEREYVKRALSAVVRVPVVAARGVLRDRLA